MSLNLTLKADSLQTFYSLASISEQPVIAVIAFVFHVRLEKVHGGTLTNTQSPTQTHGHWNPNPLDNIPWGEVCLPERFQRQVANHQIALDRTPQVQTQQMLPQWASSERCLLGLMLRSGAAPLGMSCCSAYIHTNKHVHIQRQFFIVLMRCTELWSKVGAGSNF